MNLKTVKKCSIGMVSELKAQVWLLQQGFEVFGNIKPSGPADLIAWDIENDKILKVDVKTVKVYTKQDGSKNYIFSSLGNANLKTASNRVIEGIHYLGFCEEEDRFLWFSDVQKEAQG